MTVELLWDCLIAAALGATTAFSLFVMPLLVVEKMLGIQLIDL